MYILEIMKNNFSFLDPRKGPFQLDLLCGELVEADKADVEAGLAKCVGDEFKLPTIVEVMIDGSYTVETMDKQNPCAWKPCEMFPFKISVCSKEEDFIAKCGEISICKYTVLLILKFQSLL